MFTQIEREEVAIGQAFDDLAPEQKIQQVQASEQEVADNVNYQRALALQNRVYCELIEDESMKLKCEENTPEPVEKEPVEEKSPELVADQTNYQRALAFRNEVYCELIISEDLKSDCFSALEI